jgi:hypothetical protein
VGDASSDQASDQSESVATDPLVESLEEQVDYLREQLRREQEASAELRRIVAGLVHSACRSWSPHEKPPQRRENCLKTGAQGSESRVLRAAEAILVAAVLRPLSGATRRGCGLVV